MNQKLLGEILAYIDAHIQDKVNLKELADLSGYSPFYFSRIFSEDMGISVTSYIRIRKMQFALQSLGKGKAVLEVALLYGFDSHEGFTRSFTQLFGFNPRTAKKFITSYEVPKYVVPMEDRRMSMETKKRESLQEDMYRIAYEIMDASLQEAREGHCTEITVEVLPGNYVKITDNGRGIPLVSGDKKNREALEKICGGHPVTNLEYGQIGDLMTSGLQAACSLCENFQVTVYRYGKEYRQDYIRGIAQHELYESDSNHCSGMEVVFKPDEKIFGENGFEENKLKEWLYEMRSLGYKD